MPLPVDLSRRLLRVATVLESRRAGRFVPVSRAEGEALDDSQVETVLTSIEGELQITELWEEKPDGL